MPIIKQETFTHMGNPIIVEVNEIHIRGRIEGKTMVRYKTAINGGKRNGISHYYSNQKAALQAYASLINLVESDIKASDE